MDGQHHFARLRRIVEVLVLSQTTAVLFLPLRPTNVYTKLNEFVIDHILKGIRCSSIRRTLDSDCTLVILAAGRTPRPVLFTLHTITLPSHRYHSWSLPVLWWVQKILPASPHCTAQLQCGVMQSIL